MIYDIRTVFVKECKELIRFRSNTRGGVIGIAVFLCVFGIFLPLQMGRAWIDSPLVLYFWAWVPLFLVSSVIADSFAGEKERNTIETLLASRLPDRAILLGKAASGVWYGWSLTMISLVLGTIAINLTIDQETFLFYGPGMLLGVLLWSLLSAGLAAGVGIIVSLRAVTVRQAQQSLSISIMLLLFIPVLGVRAISDKTKELLFDWFEAFTLQEVVLTVSAILLVLDIILLKAAMVRFKRENLILD